MLRMLAFSSLLLAGCIPSGTTIEIHDKETFTPNVRLSLGQPGELRAGPAFELGVAQTRGRGTQFIPAGESSSLGSETFYGPREISSELSLSVKTVSTYRARLLAKMGLRTNSEITRYVFEHQLLPV